MKVYPSKSFLQSFEEHNAVCRCQLLKCFSAHPWTWITSLFWRERFMLYLKVSRCYALYDNNHNQNLFNRIECTMKLFAWKVLMTHAFHFFFPKGFKSTVRISGKMKESDSREFRKIPFKSFLRCNRIKSYVPFLYKFKISARIP